MYAACNYGSTALVTRSGQLLMFGKDAQHTDTTGMVTALKSEKIVQVCRQILIQISVIDKPFSMSHIKKKFLMIITNMCVSELITKV